MGENVKKGYLLEMKSSMKLAKKENLSSFILVSPRFLRSYGAGQVDLCTIEKNRFFGFEINIYEVKSFAFLSFSQRSKLEKSALLLSEIFKLPVRISVLFQDF